MANPLSPTSGHVLRLSQGPVHSWLQHIAGVSDNSHGHSLQIQVSATTCPPKSAFSKLVHDMKTGFIYICCIFFKYLNPVRKKWIQFSHN